MLRFNGEVLRRNHHHRGSGTTVSVADTVIEAVKSGAIKPLRSSVAATALPEPQLLHRCRRPCAQDTVLMTLGCNKYRFNTHDFGDIGGIPRLLDVGQCNDSYSAIQIALALADAFDCGVSDLPLSLFVSWFEQKAAAVLLTLLSLGIRNIRLGPPCPRSSPRAVIDILVDKFALKPIGDPPRISLTRWPGPDDRIAGSPAESRSRFLSTSSWSPTTV